jgi:hypothetical protein
MKMRQSKASAAAASKDWADRRAAEKAARAESAKADDK